MPKFKHHRQNVKVDMTPLVDVAFLLLTFFMLTTSFKPPEEVTIELPRSHSDFKLPESNVMTINIAKDGRTVDLRMFTDPRGNDEVQKGSLLPKRGIAESSLPGSAVAPALMDGETYYWQIWGKITTTHGDERVEGPLSRFLYFQEFSSVQYLGLSAADKNTITDELIAILTELVNKRAAKSIKEYEIDRIVLDNGVVTRDEVFAILAAIKEKQVKVNSIYFR